MIATPSFVGPQPAPAPIPAADIYDVATRGPDMGIHVVGFAGGGGSSKGYRLAGLRVHVALNHNREAMAMHRRNHEETEHFIEDIRTVDPRVACSWRKVWSAWFSPDCRDFSKAKQGKPKSKRIRGLAWVIIHWINSLGPNAPEVIFLENVEEFRTWCSLLPNGKRNNWRKGWFFRCFIGALERRGYNVEWREQRACDYGAPTIRKRLFLVARRDEQPIVWPEPTHGAPESEGVRAGRLQAYRTAADCLELWRPCPSIFLTRRQARTYKRTHGIQLKRPLARASLRRIAIGVGRHVIHAAQPYLCFLTEHGNASAQRNFSANEPLRTQCAAVKGGHFALVGASIAKLRGSPADHPPGHSAHEPLHTVSANGNHHGLIAAFLAQNNGGEKGHQTYGHSVDKPVSTITGKCSNQSVIAASLVKYYGADQDPQMAEPLHSVTTVDRFGLVQSECVPVLTPELAVKARQVAKFLRRFGVKFEGQFATVGGYIIVDIGMRMLTPRELYRAQGFSDDYVIDRGWVLREDGTTEEIQLSGKAQVRMCGNSVSPVHAAALIRANLNQTPMAAAA